MSVLLQSDQLLPANALSHRYVVLKTTGEIIIRDTHTQTKKLSLTSKKCSLVGGYYRLSGNNSTFTKFKLFAVEGNTVYGYFIRRIEVMIHKTSSGSFKDVAMLQEYNTLHSYSTTPISHTHLVVCKV